MSRTRRAARWCAGATLVALLVAFWRFDSIERNVAMRLIGALRERGLQAEIGSLDLDLPRRELRARDVAIGAPGEPPSLRIRSLAVRVPWRALTGAIAIDEVALEGVRITLRRDVAASAAAPRGTAVLPSIGRVRVRDASFSLVDAANAASIDAAGLSLDGGTLGAALRVTVVASQPVRLQIGASSHELRLGSTLLSLETGDLAVDTTLTADGSSARVSGNVRDALGEARLELAAKGRADPRLLTSELRGSVDFDAAIGGTAAAPEAEIRLESERLDAAIGITATALRAQLRTNSRRATLASFEAAAAGGRVSASGEVAFEGASRLELGWQAIDIGLELRRRVPALERWTGRARGHAALRFAGLEISSASATGEASIEPGPMDGGRIGVAARLRLDADASSWRLAIEGAHAAGVAASGAVTIARARPPAPAAVGGSVTLRAPALASSLASFAPGLLPSLEGQAEARLELGGTLNAPTARVEMTASGIGVRGDPRPRVSGHSEIRLTRDRADVVSIEASADGARADGSAGVVFESGALTGTIRAALSDLSRWAPEAAPADGSVDLDLTLGGTLRQPRLGCRLRSTTATLGALPLAALDGELHVDRSQIAIDSLEARPIAGGRATLLGSLELGSGAASALKLRLEDAELTAMAQASLPTTTSLIVSGELDLAGTLHDLGSLRAEGRLHRFDLDLARGKLRLERDAAWRFGPDQIAVEKLDLLLGEARLSLDGWLDATDAGRLEARLSGPLRDLARLVPTAATVEGEIPTERDKLVRSLRGVTQATVVWTGPATRPTATGAFSLREGRALDFDTALEAEYSAGTLTLGQLLVTDQDMRLEGSASLTTSLFDDSLPRRYRESVADLPPLGKLQLRLTARPDKARPPQAREVGSAVVDLESDALDFARVRGQVSLQNLDLNVEGERLAQQGPGRIQIGEGRLVLEGLSWRGSQSDFSITGDAHLASTGEPLQDASLAFATTGALDLRLLGGLGRGIEGGGTARVDLTLAGSPRAPQIGGSVELRDGLLRYRPRRLSLDGLQGRILLAQQKATIETLSGSLNGGSFEATGSIDLSALPPRSGRITATSRGALLDWPRGALAELDTKLALVIEDAVPRLEGEILVASSSYDGNPLQLYTGFEAWRALPTEASALDRLGFDLRLRSASKLRADTQFGRLDLGADVRLGGTFGEPLLEGRIDADAGGTILLGSRTYTLEQMTLDFTRAGGLVPSLRSRATTRVASHFITAEFSGPLDAPQTRLRSAPPLSENEIASLLTTGSIDRSGASKGDAMSLVTASMLGSMGRSVGFDTLRLEGKRDDDLLNEDRFSFDPTAVNSAADPESRLTITKRLNPQLEVTLSQSLASGGKRTSLVSWAPILNVEARAVDRDDDTFSFELRHDLSLGGSPKPRDARPKKAGAARERIGGVRIQSDGGPPVELLQKRLTLGEGDTFEYRTWLQDRERLQQALAEAGYFEARVFGTREPRLGSETAGQPVVLSYDVRCGARTAVHFEGFAVPASLRQRVERSWWASEFDTSVETEAADLTRAALLDLGYPTPVIDGRVSDDRASGRILVVRVEPGLQAARRRIVFSGNQALPTNTLAALVKSTDTERRAFLKPAALANDVQLLLAQAGLLNASVKTETTLENGVATLRVSISEGVAFKLGAVAASGVARLDSQEVLLASGLVSGGAYSKPLLENARSKVTALYRKRGFVDAAVAIDGRTHARSGSVDATIKVTEGARQVVAEVVIDGADSAAVGKSVREGGVAVGKPVVAQEWSDVSRRIYETGVVRQVDLEAEPIGERTPEGDQPVRAHLKAEEWPALRLRYGLQLAGTRDPLDEEGKQQFRLGGIAEASRQTLFGRGITSGLSVQGRQGFLSARGYLSLPRTFGTAARSSVFVSEERDDRDLSVLGEVSTIRSDSTKLTFEERIRLIRLADLALAYGLEWTRFTGQVPLFGPLDVRARVARVTGSLVFDRRDTVIDTTRGFFQSSGLEWGAPGLGSQFSFNKLLLQQYAFLGAPVRTVLATAVRWERAAGADQALLTTGRLSAGGASTVRGFPEDLGGAVSFGQDQPTSSLIVFNQELRFPLLGSLFGGAFFDHASRFTAGAGRILNRSSVGLGLRFRTAVGVLRLDYGYPLGVSGKRGTFYFALGQAF